MNPLLLIFLLLLFLLVRRSQEISPSFLFLHNHLLLLLPKRANPVTRAWQPANAVRNLASADQTGDDGGADDEGEHKAVDAVPRRGPAALRSPGVGVVEEVEDEELGDQGVFGREQDGRPSEGSADNTDLVAGVALVATKAGPFKTPVDGTKERDDLSKTRQ